MLIFEESVAGKSPAESLPIKHCGSIHFAQASDPHACIRNLELVAANGDCVRFRLNEPLAIYSRATLNGLLLRRAEAGARSCGNVF